MSVHNAWCNITWGGPQMGFGLPISRQILTRMWPVRIAWKIGTKPWNLEPRLRRLNSWS